MESAKGQRAFSFDKGLDFAGGCEFDYDCLLSIHKSVERRLIALGVSSLDVEDVCLECLYGVKSKMAFYNPGLGSFESWVSGFVRNAARLWRAKNLRRSRLEAELHNQADQTSSSPMQDALISALNCLNESERHLLDQRFLMQKEHAEIAESFGVTSIVIRKKISRSIEKLRKSAFLQEFLV